MTEKTLQAGGRAATKVSETVRTAVSRASGTVDTLVGRASAATGLSQKTVRIGLFVGAGLLVGLLLRRRSRG